MVSGPPLRIVFFGTPAFAVPTLDALLASRHDVLGVVTQPDRPRGRGQRTTYAPLKARAVEAGVPVLQPDKLRDPAFVDSFNALRADLGVVAAYGKILPESLIATPRLGMINVHASLLPRYRGAAPVHRAIIAGDRETGVTIMRVVKALDAGPVMASARREILPDETSDAVERDLAQIGAGLLVSVADQLAAGTAVEAPQDDAQATYAPRLTRDEGLVDWSLPAGRVHDLVRGLYPWPHAYTFLDGRRYILLETRVASAAEPAHGPPGSILAAAGDMLTVATGAGALDLVKLQAEGKRPMGVREFLAGHQLAVGQRFGGSA